jgi:uncharacterized membrane protein YoaT (DUF817 family)
MISLHHAVSAVVAFSARPAEPVVEGAGMRSLGRDLAAFSLLQARACVFALGFFAILVASRFVGIPGVPRYDLILVLSVLLQMALVSTGVETLDEVKALSLFHVFGLALELFKTHPAIASWAYPEPSYVRIASVPLYSGFMYAAVASYMIQAWRLLDLSLEAFPDPRASALLALVIYANFFTHHFLWDVRWPLTAAVLVLFRRTRVRFRVRGTEHTIPLVLSFVAIGFAVWIAENFATLGGAWAYPDQRLGWRPVSLGKVHSWTLLVILSFVIVADLKWVKARRAGRPEAASPANLSPLWRESTACVRTSSFGGRGWRSSV